MQRFTDRANGVLDVSVEGAQIDASLVDESLIKAASGKFHALKQVGKGCIVISTIPKYVHCFSNYFIEFEFSRATDGRGYLIALDHGKYMEPFGPQYKRYFRDDAPSVGAQLS